MENQQTNVLPSGYEGLTFEKVWATIQETDRQLKEQALEAARRSKEADRRFQETERMMKEQARETDRQIRQNQKLMGDLSRKFGKIIEHMFIPNLHEKFNLLGYEFGQSAPNVLIHNREHKIYMEIDVFLENGDCALAVEVKVQASIDDVREHMERMEKLRKHFDLKQDKRKLYGAIAGAVILDNVRDYALRQGFYVIRQSGDAINVEAPPGKPKSW